MKKAVIETGNKQYLVQEGQVILIDYVGQNNKPLTFKPLLLVNEDKVSVGKPFVDNATVKASIEELAEKQPKTRSIRYKAKKRIHKIRGHRQSLTKIKITSIK